MNWKHKTLILGSVASMGLVPMMSIVTSCSKNSVINKISETVTSEFQWICTHYRNTFNNREFCHDLTKRIKQMGFVPVTGWDEVNGRPLPIDKGGYAPADKSTPFGYNIYFDVPSNLGDSYPTIVLQAHTDMVCVVADDPATKKPYPYDWSNGVETIIEDGWMHSKDWKTSLGADDGAGIATILALAKHAKEFPHGKIRCLFTVDEEDGESGAKYVPASWYDGVKYYLSLDGENTHINWNYSAGADQTSWFIKDAGTPTAGQKRFTVSITGFAGGHSGLKIHLKHMNALIIMGEVLAKLIGDTTNFQNVRLINCWDNVKKESNPTPGTIPSAVNFTFEANTTKSTNDVKAIIQSVIDQQRPEADPQSGEPDKSVITTTVTDAIPSANEGITKEVTSNLAYFLSSYKVNKIYGFSLDEEGKFPKIGSNVGGVRLGEGVAGSNAKNKLYIEFFGRSTDPTELDKFYMNDLPKDEKGKPDRTKQPATDNPTSTYVKAIKGAFGDEPVKTNWGAIAFNEPWVKNSADKLQKIIHDASKNYNNELVDEPVFGWLEIAETYAKRPDIQFGIIGPQIMDVHTPKERIELSSLPLMAKLVLYILENLEPK